MRFKQLFQIMHKTTTSLPTLLHAHLGLRSATTTTTSNAKLTYPSADRNSQPIANAFLLQLSSEPSRSDLHLLEISSGTGQHAGFLAPLFPHITFQPTEYDRSLFASISAYAADCPTGNICQPLLLDISQDVTSLPPATYDYMFNCNMLHISPWTCAVGLFRNAGKLLKPGGKLFTYGPYALHGVLQPQSNVDFDRSLRARNPEWGVRDIDDLEQLAVQNGLQLKDTQEMPSNNKFLTWLKQH